jgi:site-specific recombinase XerD
MEAPIVAQDSLRTSIDTAVKAWLEAKKTRGQSANTEKAYERTIHDFRFYLRSCGHELDSDTAALRIDLQRWLADKKLAPASQSQKLAIISSFYQYAITRDVPIRNPVTDDLRPRVQQYAAVTADPTVFDKLATIDTTSDTGARDYAILYTALMTGRRVAEIASLRIGDIAHQGDTVTLTFRHTKGNRMARNIFRSEEIRPLLAYLTRVYSPAWKEQPDDSPVWISSSRNSSKGKALSVRSLETICTERLGVHFHALRHIFAKEMEDCGEKISSIQSYLGHSSIATTGRYLAALNSGRNTSAGKLAAKLQQR